jgi:hypothetical protein
MSTVHKDFGRNLKHRLAELGLTCGCELVGCELEDIEEAKLNQGVTFLPRAYIDFLLEMGKCAGCLFLGSDYDCDAICILKDSHKQDIASLDMPFQIPEDVFIFLSHQGYVFWYFHTADQLEDPPIYKYVENNSTAVIVSSSLTQFFEMWIHDLLQLRT